ncbi:MAG: NAD(P)/FAD-dependent oxidoreductase [Dehalococcoidia bacterium]
MDADVIVIGGGPAGSAAATMLARMGSKVILLERERFPREHVGESLLPASLPILEELGVLPTVAAEGFVKKYGATMVWGAGNERWSWHFGETNKTHPHAYQVWRPRFDQILLENAAATGVDVRQQHRVLDVELGGQDAMSVRVAGAGREFVLTSRFLVDASGQSGLVVRKLGLREDDPDFQNLAMYAYYEGAARLPEPDAGNIFIESFEHGWFWNIPLHNGLMSVGAVVDHRVGSEGIRQQGLEAYFESQVAEAPHTALMLSAAHRTAPPAVIRDWSYAASQVVGDGWIVAGDAACFIDPLFSTGVHLALSAGVMAAAYVTTALTDSELAAAAGPVYKDLYYSQYDLFRQLARLFYSTNRSVDSYFWEARRITGFDDALSPRSAFIRAVAGQPPKGYERAVLARGDVPDALLSGVEEIGATRQARRDHYQSLIPAGDTGRPAVLATKPRPAPGARTERRPVLGPGKFEWGDVLLSDERPEGMAVSSLVAVLLGQCNGAQSVEDIAVGLAQRSKRSPAEIAPAIIQALGILYADGAIELS